MSFCDPPIPMIEALQRLIDARLETWRAAQVEYTTLAMAEERLLALRQQMYNIFLNKAK